MLTVLCKSGAALVKDIGNIWFYIFTIVLIVAVVVICTLFTRSKRFKIRMREKLLKTQQEYEPPQLIVVEDAMTARRHDEWKAEAAQKTERPGELITLPVVEMTAPNTKTRAPRARKPRAKKTQAPSEEK